MKTENEIKEEVKKAYNNVAEQSLTDNLTSCCGTGCGCSTIDEAIMADNYSELEGYVADADLGLGCGLPTEFAQIKEGDIVVDLGSGAGNDCFVARAITGESGKVIGVDFSEKMLEKARKNVATLGYTNVEFVQGDIEQIPLQEELADVIISNCVLNLVPNKKNVVKEIHRVLKTGGHFSISDIVLQGDLPDELKQDMEMYAGCISGAIQMEEYLNIIKETGFKNITIQKQKQIHVPDELLLKYVSADTLTDFKQSQTGIYSITVYADK